MADERLRRLERAAADGDPAARVRWYRARLLQGDLTHLRLKLAAHLGDAAAQEALGPDLYTPTETFADWARILTGGGKETSVRAAWAATWTPEASRRWPLAFDAVETWIECPCRDHARQARKVAQALSSALTPEGVVELTTAVAELNLTRAATAACAAILASRNGSRAAIRTAIADLLLPWILADREPLPPTELSD